MRVVFAGTPQVAADILKELLQFKPDTSNAIQFGNAKNFEFEIVGAISRPPSPVGRKKILTSSPVANVANSAGISLLETTNKAEISEWVKNLDIDLGVVVAFGVLFNQQILDAPKRGWVNAHFSLLPQFRGAAPVQHSILHGGKASGITLFQLDKGMDTGPIFSTLPVGLGPEATTETALKVLTPLAAKEIIQLLHNFSLGEAISFPQEGEASFANKISVAEARIDWNANARNIDRLIRATNPEPGAWSTQAGTRIKLHNSRFSAEDSLAPGQISMNSGKVLVGAGTNAIELLEVQPAGKNRMSAGDWYRGSIMSKDVASFDIE
ncbi:MAG: methionyl-tRNA formyltransferase [Microbacteriaceae bacterium]|nr:methionyl-tRNA formyltransferase [Microbacteriaceae bacterium]